LSESFAICVHVHVADDTCGDCNQDWPLRSSIHACRSGRCANGHKLHKIYEGKLRLLQLELIDRHGLPYTRSRCNSAAEKTQFVSSSPTSCKQQHQCCSRVHCASCNVVCAVVMQRGTRTVRMNTHSFAQSLQHLRSKPLPAGTNTTLPTTTAITTNSTKQTTSGR
jgi:hypothetical protein